MTEPTLHIHTWNDDNADPTICTDAEHVDTYPDPDGYFQFGKDIDGTWYEIRLSFNDLDRLIELRKESRERYKD